MFQVLNIVDEGVRETLDIVVDTPITAACIVWVLEQLEADQGVSKVILLDKGAEMRVRVFLHW